MSVVIQNNIGYGAKSGALFFEMGARSEFEASPQPKKDFDNTQLISPQPAFKYAPWGNDNKFPLQLVNYMETCGILNAIVDGKARFAIGRGLLPVLGDWNANGEFIVKEVVKDPEITGFLDRNRMFFQCFGWMKDLCGFANGVARIMLTPERDKIAGLIRQDVTEMRYEQMDDKGRINKIYLCAEWERLAGVDDPNVLELPLLNPDQPLMDLESRKTGYEFAMTFRYPGWNKKYYSLPLWYAAIEWVKIAQGVPKMKAAMYNNNMRPKYMVIIYQDYWDRVFVDESGNPKDYTEQEKQQMRQQIYDEIEAYLVGGDNAYKSVFVSGNRSTDGSKTWQDIEIKPIEDKSIDGELLKDSSTANSEIAFALLFNPSIIGASLPSGPYTNSQGGSNVRESVLLQVILHELERQHIRDLMNVVKYYNKWNERYPDLEFIIPATIPTTLDTGGSSKAAITGGGGNVPAEQSKK